MCPRGHSYDIARSGYINLLQPQDRRSLDAGDAPAAVEARGRLLNAGVGRTLIDEVVRVAAAQLRAKSVVADLGSGTGDALDALTNGRRVRGVGIDLSTAAARYAARRFPHLTWVVANADRRLPLVDSGVTLITSLHGRRNPRENARVLTAMGLLLVAVPAPDDLIELRAHVQGSGVERSRIDTLIGEHEEKFDVIERFAARERRTLNAGQLVDVLRSTYRGARASLRQNIESLSTLDVTFASDCVLFRRRG